MRRLVVVATCVVAVVGIGAAVASTVLGGSGLYGLRTSVSAKPAPSGETLLELEVASLTRQGISRARAYKAIAVQGAVARVDLVAKEEAALGAAYAGAWFEPATAKVHLGVTSGASRRRAAAIAARAGLASDVVESPVRSTWAGLRTAQARWNRRLASLPAKAHATTALNSQSNAVMVKLGPSVPRAERAALERVASRARVNVDVGVEQYGGSRDTVSTSCNRFESSKTAYCNPSLTSGVLINGPARCTAGPMAIPRASKNETYVLTAGHCLTKGGIGSKWFALNRAGTKIEIGAAVEGFDGTKADVGAIKIENAGWKTAAEKDPLLAVAAQWLEIHEISYPVEGERQAMIGEAICLEGSTTGQSCGTVMATGVTADFGAEGVVQQVNEVLGLGGEPGDSGGPVMLIQTNTSKTVRMDGTYIGKLAGGKYYYEPLPLIYKALTKLNLELLTTANENRP